MAMPRKWPRGYYAYIWKFPDGIPYYVGAGKNGRCIPENRIVNGRMIERELEKEGKKSIIEIFPVSSEEEALDLEEKLILQIGRKDLGTGPLLNRTNGRGSKGRIQTPEFYMKISIKNKGRKQTEEQRAATSVRMKGKPCSLGYRHSEEMKKYIGSKSKGRKLSEETRKKMSIAACNRKKRCT